MEFFPYPQIVISVSLLALLLPTFLKPTQICGGVKKTWLIVTSSSDDELTLVCGANYTVLTNAPHFIETD